MTAILFKPTFKIQWGNSISYNATDCVSCRISLSEDDKSASLNFGLNYTTGIKLGELNEKIVIEFGYPRQKWVKMTFTCNSIDVNVGAERLVEVGAKGESWKMNREKVNTSAENTMLIDLIQDRAARNGVRVTFTPNFLNKPIDYSNQSESNLELLVREAHEVGAVVVDDPKTQTVRVQHPYELRPGGKLFWLGKPLLESIRVNSSTEEENKQPTSNANPQQSDDQARRQTPEQVPTGSQAEPNRAESPVTQNQNKSKKTANKVKNDIKLSTEFALVPQAIYLEPGDWLGLAFEKTLRDWQISSVDFDLVACRVSLQAGRPRTKEPLIDAGEPPANLAMFYWGQ